MFINGVATELGRGPVDVKAMFGGDFVVFHSSGAAVEVNEHGFLVQSLQHGESYFLVFLSSSFFYFFSFLMNKIKILLHSLL